MQPVGGMLRQPVMLVLGLKTKIFGLGLDVADLVNIIADNGNKSKK
jgi:hypothetical protein